MEVIDIGIENLEPISSGDVKPKEVNFGPGIELLMNDKSPATKEEVNLNLDDIDNLEKEMNDLSSSIEINDTQKKEDTSSSLFSNMEPSIKLDVNDTFNDSNLGKDTKDTLGNTSTWDGFSKINEVPNVKPGSSAKLSEREMRRKKRHMIKKLEEWHQKKLISNFPNFTMESDFDEVEDEYETALEDKRKKDSVKLQGWWFMTFINTVEYANASFNPFDLNLDGWGEQVSEDIDSYDEIFGELYEKYKGGKMAPELSLLLRVGFSAAVLNFSNKALSSATPAFNDVIKQNPDLMRMFTDATVSSMSQQSPGFEFANNLMQEQMNKPRGPPPPAPVETKSQPPPSRPGMTFTDAPSNRPDINASRGSMFREKGVELNNGMSNINDDSQTKSIRPPARAEMKGPQSSDIDDILSGLKTRKVDIQRESVDESKGNESMVSVSSLKDLQNTSVPKSNRKRNKSDKEKNTISLDI